MTPIVSVQHKTAKQAGIVRAQKTMTSREIAELVESRHDKVKQSIERLSKNHIIGLPPMGEYLDTLGRPAQEYKICKRDSYIIVAQLSPEFTARLVDRWQELEAGIPASVAAPAAPKPTAIQPSKEFRALFGIARLIGMDKNAAAISANHGVKALTGTNMLALMDATHLKSATQSLHFTPTELGKRLCISAVTFNRKLADAGLQERVSGHWSPTSRGKPYAVVLDTGRAHESGTPVQQVKWIEAVLDEVAA